MKNWDDRRVFACLALLMACATPAVGARLPVRAYTTAEGLAHDRVEVVLQDSRGFLWFGTALGLSRFDGYRFATVGEDGESPRPAVTALVEAAGEYWVGTEDGICVFRAAAPRCEKRPTGDDRASRRVNALLRDRGGRVWAGTDRGVFRADPRGASFARVALPSTEGTPPRIFALAEGKDGSVWLGGEGGLWRWLPGDRVLHYETEWTPDDLVFSILMDGEDRVWVGGRGGLVTLSPRLPAAGEESPSLRLAPEGCARALRELPVGEACLVLRAPGPARHVLALVRSSDGTVWAGTRNAGVFELTAGTTRRHSTDDGLASNAVRALHEDRDENLWIGTEGRGVLKLARGGLVSYGRDDGLLNARIMSVFGDGAGEVYVHNAAARLGRLRDGKWSDVQPLRRGIRGPWGFGQRVALVDRTGVWWMGTAHGLCRFGRTHGFAELERAFPSERLSPDPDGELTPTGPLLEDRRGDIWAGGMHEERPVLLRWERATQTSRTYDLPKDLPPSSRVFVLRDDPSGTLWIGMTEGGLVRLRNGRAERIGLEGRDAMNTIRDVHVDGAGRLWLAGDQAGLGRIDQPGSDRPQASWWGRAEGLAGPAYCLGEDRWGRLYVGTSLGVTRLDPATGRLRHYGTADGLSAGEVHSAFTDAQGRLWFGTMDGVSVLTPALEAPAQAPRAFIASLRIAGVQRPLSVLGENEVTGIDLAREEAQVEIEYASLGFGVGQRLRYRYRLEGADRDWSPPTERRTVSYARLAPGSYRFTVEAVNADDAASPQAASVAFRVLPALWQRGWFLTAAVLVTGLAAYAGFRYRLGMLLELERVRLRVASDLHDDIGSNLSKIAILSEVAQRQEPAPQEASLARIADMARQLVDSMSDIVWAVNPSRDSLPDLSRRMREFATELFSALDVPLRFEGPPDSAVPIGAELRRQVFLIFKEAVTNAASYSRCRRVDVSLHVERGALTLRVADDGEGFDLAGAGDGHGLQSMRERALAIDGEIDVRSAPGQGTVVLLRAPLSPRGRRRHYLSG